MSAASRPDGPESTVSFAARGDNVTIRVSGYLFADPEHARDANALTGTVNIRAGAFGGSYRAMFHTWDFAELRDRLAEMHDDLHGEARFDTLELGMDWIDQHIGVQRRQGGRHKERQ